MLSRVQLSVLGGLLLLPILLFAAVGAWELWGSGWLFWLSWSMPICWGLAWGLLRFWGKPLVAPPPDLDQAHWTPRDEAAAEIIRQEQERAKTIAPENLIDLRFYSEATRELAAKIARHYHPTAADPLSDLTVLEILAAAQLVSEDLEGWFQRSVPGSHLVTIAQWQMLSRAPKWWQLASNVGWVASILINPANIGRYFVSKLAVDPLSKELQGSLLTAFYMLYLRQVGYYLIEMNSGRLRGGAAHYRKIMGRLSERQETSGSSDMGRPPPTSDGSAVEVSIAVIGQVKAGKSSLVNSFLGEQQAVVDVLPNTRSVQRYRLKPLAGSGGNETLTLLDTPGYGEAGATPEQFRETLEAVRNADLVVVVLEGRSPAKKADAKVLEELSGWYADHPQLKPPPMVGVISKIDLLSPVREWEPPYDWRHPRGAKEASIAGAVEYVRETLGAYFDAVVPVCTDRAHDRRYGVDEFLIPSVTALLTEARAASLLRTLHREQERGKYVKVLQQAVGAGRQLIELWKRGTRQEARDNDQETRNDQTV
jgi:predicted GTPase